jgi:hypothetical protein
MQHKFSGWQLPLLCETPNEKPPDVLKKVLIFLPSFSVSNLSELLLLTS